jgi:hypothetical protein
MFEKLVPEQGDAPTTLGEILRISSKIYYDIYNNGGCNLKQDHFLGWASFLRYESKKFSQIAKTHGVEKFVGKLTRFCKGKTTDQENDQVMDVLIVSVYRKYHQAVQFLRNQRTVELLLSKRPLALLQDWESIN